MITPRSSAAFSAALGMLAVTTLAHAQPSAAEAAFTQGLADMQAGRYDTGCPALAESQRLDPRPGTLFTLAECEAKRGRIGTALAHYREYLALYDAMKPEQKSRQSERAKIATKQRTALEAQVPTLALVLPPDAPPGLSIKRDGTLMEASVFGEAIPLDPGEHVVTTQAPGAPMTERRVTLAPGDHKQILIDARGAMDAPKTVAPPPPPVPAEPPPEGGPSGRRVAGYVVGGLGLFGLALGGVAGGITLGKKSVIKENCNLGGDETLCNHEGKVAADSAKTTGIISTVGFAVGGAAVVTAVVLLVTAPRKKPVAAGSTRVRGDVLAAGRDGAVLGIHGAW